MKKNIVFSLALALICGLFAGAAHAQIPMPMLNGIAPASAVAGGGSFTVTAYGNGFATNAVINWNGSARATNYISATQLTASILASDVVVAGSHQITVSSPTPGGGISNSAILRVDPNGVITPTLPNTGFGPTNDESTKTMTIAFVVFSIVALGAIALRKRLVM